MACIIQITHFLCKVKFEYNQKKFKVTCLKFTHQGIQVHLTFLPFSPLPHNAGAGGKTPFTPTKSFTS